MHTDPKLAQASADMRSLVRLFGSERAKKIALRLQHLNTVDNLEEMRTMPGHCHELTGDYAGHLALDLDGPFRLIFAPTNPVYRDGGGISWRDITEVAIVGIVDYH